jgi:hypothetical protein
MRLKGRDDDDAFVLRDVVVMLIEAFPMISFPSWLLTFCATVAPCDCARTSPFLRSKFAKSVCDRRVRYREPFYLYGYCSSSTDSSC